MKNPYLILLVLGFFACNKTTETKTDSVEETVSYANFSISMDTVILDSKDEIVMAAVYSPYGHQISPDLSKHLYWNVREFTLEMIDLDKFELIKKAEFNREGPDGVGFALDIEMIDQEHIAFHNWDQSVISDLNGNVVERISKQEDWMKQGLKPNENFHVRFTSKDRNLMYCSISNFERLNSNILKLDLKNQKADLIELPEFDKRENFRVAYSTGGGGGAYFPLLLVSKYEDKFIFWTDAFNAIYQYDPGTDSLSYHKIINTLFANEKSGEYKNDVSSNIELQAEMDRMNEEIKFSKLFWDEKNKVFYRFSHFGLPDIGEEPPRYKHFMSIIDEAFQVLGEREITEIFPNPINILFVKDGLIYSHLNVDDELGYVRIKVN